MCYELFNPSTFVERKFSRQCWTKALELARLYGWSPMGTLPPSVHDFRKLGADWNGTYLTNDGQVVRGGDAYLLALALERSLDDIPESAPRLNWNFQFWLEDELPEWLAPWEQDLIEEELQDGMLDLLGVHPLEYFAGAEKDRLKEFIRFCRLGSFTIW